MDAQTPDETSLTIFFKDVMAKCQPMSRTVGVMGMTLKTDEFAQFDNVYKRASSVYPALVGDGATEELWRKSYAVSEKLREQGNKNFAERNLAAAMDCYSSALRFAPWSSSSLASMTTTNIDNTPCIAANTTESSSEAEDDSTAAVEDDSAPKASANSSTELCGTLPNSSQLDPAPVVGYSHDVGRDNAQLAKCHANRSAVLFELGRYGDCCAEVDRALGTNDYPTETEWKLLARKARAAVHLRQFSVAEECVRCLESLVENFPDNDVVRGRILEAISTLKVQITEGQQNTTNVTGNAKKTFEASRASSTSTPKTDSAISTTTCIRNKNPLYKHASDALLELTVDEKKGKGFCVGADDEVVGPGTLLIEEPSLVRFLDSDCWPTHCFNCFVRVGDLPLPCRFSPAIVLCCEGCAERQNTHGFEDVCCLLPYIGGTDNSATRLIRLAFTLLARQPWPELREIFYGHELRRSSGDGASGGKGRDGPDDDSGTYPTDVRCLNWLARSDKQDSDPEWVWEHAVHALFVTQLLLARRYMPMSDNDEICRLGALALRAIKIMDACGFACHENVAGSPDSATLYMKDIGIFLAPTVGRLNHSCVPNAAVTFARGVVAVRTLTAVGRGQEVCVSYGPDLLSTKDREERWEKLKSGWGFVCACEPCRREWVAIDELPQLTVKCSNCGLFSPETQLSSRCPGCKLSGEEQVRSVRRILNSIGEHERDMVALLGAGARPAGSGDALMLSGHDDVRTRKRAEFREKRLPRLLHDIRSLQENVASDSSLYIEAVGMLENALDFAFNPHFHRL